MKKLERFVGILTLMLISTFLMAVLSPASAQTYQTAELEVKFIDAYEEVWNDRGSGADLDISFWRPMPPAGWYRVGHHAKLDYENPTEATMVVKPMSSGILVEPNGYTQIWNDAGSGAPRDGSVWRPVCPSGYQALGDVASGSHQMPSTNEVRCVRESALTSALPGDFIWNDAGSGANRDFGAWGIQTSDPNLTCGLFYGAASHARPADAEVLWVVLMSDHLHFEYTQTFEKVWDDAGSGAPRDVGFFSPVTQQGFYALGHYAHASHATPNASVLVVSEKTPGALAAPLDYEIIWNDAGSGANHDGAAWWPICPDNYVALGLVTSSGAKPSTEAVRCVHQDLTAQAQVGEQIWNDSGSGAHSDFGSWRIQANGAPAGEAHVAPGTFIGHASHSAISNERARVLKILK